jgi:hypothetical protein
VDPQAQAFRNVKQNRDFLADSLGTTTVAPIHFVLTMANQDGCRFAFASTPDSCRASNRTEIAAMPTTDLSEGFSGLRQWSEPLIFDRLFSTYAKLVSDDGLARALTRLHARVWRALISGDMSGFEALRETLVSALEHSSLTLNHLAEVDAEIMIELLDVVISRYNRSQRTARAYHLALMQLAGRLGPTRVAA